MTFCIDIIFEEPKVYLVPVANYYTVIIQEEEGLETTLVRQVFLPVNFRLEVLNEHAFHLNSPIRTNFVIQVFNVNVDVPSIVLADLVYLVVQEQTI